MPQDWREATRERDGRFSGARFNVEEIPRLPTFPARSRILAASSRT